MAIGLLCLSVCTRVTLKQLHCVQASALCVWFFFSHAGEHPDDMAMALAVALRLTAGFLYLFQMGPDQGDSGYLPVISFFFNTVGGAFFVRKIVHSSPGWKPIGVPFRLSSVLILSLHDAADWTLMKVLFGNLESRWSPHSFAGVFVSSLTHLCGA